MALNKELSRALRAMRLSATTFRQLAAIVFNDLRSFLADGLLLKGTLAIDATAEKFKTTTPVVYFISGVAYVKAATTALQFTAAHTVTALKHGVVLVQINAAKTISTKVVASPQAYDSAALALAAKPAPDAGNVEIGYITIEADAGNWVANTDDLTNAGDLTAATFVDATEKALPDEYPEA